MDITIKGIENVTEAEVIDWVAILVRRKEEAKLSPPVPAVEAARATIDAFRIANGLKAEFGAKEVEPVKEQPKE